MDFLNAAFVDTVITSGKGKVIPVNQNDFQSKHNNIFNNVKFATCFCYSNHHQADISVHGLRSVLTVWSPYCLHLLCRISDI